MRDFSTSSLLSFFLHSMSQEHLENIENAPVRKYNAISSLINCESIFGNSKKFIN